MLFSDARYSKAKAVNSIVRHVAEILGIKTNEELEDLYRFALQRDQHSSRNIFLLFMLLSFCCHRQVAFQLLYYMLVIFRKTAWYFETRAKKQGTAYDYFKQSVADPT